MSFSSLERVAIIGSGNWGSTISKIVGTNISRFPSAFAPTVKMWVYEEMIDGRKLTEIINNEHENVKYLPGIKLPSNVIACSDLIEVVKDATLLIFVIPHQFVDKICKDMKGKILPSARAISLTKGVETGKSGAMNLISDIIASSLGIDVSVLMGANIANEVAQEQFCEATIGYKNRENAIIWQTIFNTPYFRINIIDDVCGVELCGALKNVVAVAAGFVDGLKMGENTKAAIIRIGIQEMKKFCQLERHGIRDQTFFESCGVADVITTCFGGRNRKVAEAAVLTGKPIDILEEEMLNGQKLQGPLTAKEINGILKAKGKESDFPLFTAVYRVCYENLDPRDFFKAL